MSQLLQEFSTGQRVAALLSRRPAQQAQHSAAMSQVELLAEYFASLQRSAAVEASAANPRSAAAAATVCQEFLAWMQPRCNARGIAVQDSTPEDVRVFFESHGSTLLSDGRLHAAPSYLDSSVSHLGSLFKALGKDRPFDYETQVCSKWEPALRMLSGFHVASPWLPLPALAENRAAY
jgi:hypothetical protein